jgi:N-acetylneuraminic acid mutarotase
MAAGRNHAAGGTDGRRFWIFGGRGKGSGGGNEVANGFADVQFYDPATNTWTWSGAPSALLAPMPQARGGMGRAVHLDGEFYILGGETDSGAGATARRVYDRVDIYNPAANTWRRGNPMPAPRHGIAPVAAAGRILVAGGGDRAGLAFSNTFDYYTPPRRGLGGPSVSAAASPVPTARRP